MFQGSCGKGGFVVRYSMKTLLKISLLFNFHFRMLYNICSVSSISFSCCTLRCNIAIENCLWFVRRLSSSCLLYIYMYIHHIYARLVCLWSLEFLILCCALFMLHPGMNKITKNNLNTKQSIIHIFRLQLFPIIYAAFFWFAVVVYYNIKRKSTKFVWNFSDISG